jgi:hypothetical protein
MLIIICYTLHEIIKERRVLLDFVYDVELNEDANEFMNENYIAFSKENLG